MNKQRWLAIVVAAVAVLSTSFFYGNTLPLYDGIANPDEPYRYASPPSPKLKTAQPPSIAQQAVNAGVGAQYITIYSQEYGPQVSLYFYSDSLVAGSSTAAVNVTATPEAPNADKPTEGTIAGNIYHFAATSDSGSVTFKPDSSNPAYIDLRLPQGYAPGATFVYRQTVNGPWTSFTTNRVGNDIYEAPIVGFGDYALIVGKNNQVKPAKRSNLPLILTISILLVLVIGSIVLIRIKAVKT